MGGRRSMRIVVLAVAVLAATWGVLGGSELGLARPASAQASWRVLGAGAADPPTFRKPVSLTVGANGSVYVADEGYGFVIRVTGAGEFDGAWGRELNIQEIVKPSAVAVTTDGNMFVADRETNAIHQLSPDGTLLTSWPAGTPNGLALEREGTLLASYGGRQRKDFLDEQYHLQRLSPAGEQLGRWKINVSGGGSSPSRGTASSQGYDGVSAVAVAPSGQILLLDRRTTYNKESDGKEERHTYDVLQRLETSAPAWSSTVTSTKGIAGGDLGDAAGKFNAPMGVAVDSAGFIYVADTGNHRIQKLTADGDFVAEWGSEGSEPGQFKSPSGIAVDGQGRVYVADTGNQRVQVLESQ
jgi:tripartite motif-containing protein 71